MKSIRIVKVDVTCNNFFQEKVVDKCEELWVAFKGFIGLKLFEFFLILRWPGLKCKETDIIRKDQSEIGRKSKIEFVRNDLLGYFQCVVNNFVTSCSLFVVAFMIVINGEIWVISDFDISDFVIVDVLFIDLFANDEQSHVIFLFQHNFHLIQNKLKFFSSVHWSISLYLNLLQNVSCLHDIILVFFAFNNHQDASGILYLT